MGNAYGAYDVPGPMVAVQGQNIVLPAGPKHNSYKFTGWKDTINLYDAGDEYLVPNSNVTLWAQWGSGQTVTIDYNNIKWIFRRRYYYKNSALEIFTTTNKSFYFNFKFEKDRETVIGEITSKIKEISKIYDDLKDPKDSFDNIIGFENPNAIHSKKKTKKTKLSKKIE